MKPWKVFAFHTDLPLYINCINRLEKSLIKLDISFDILSLDYSDYGTWQNTVESKSTHILHALETNEENIVYLDADAVVNEYPVLFDTIEEDVAVHYRNGTELLASTIYFKNCSKVKQLVKDWIVNFKEGTNDMREQVYFAKTLEASDCSVYRLPPSYALIFDLMKNQDKPIIEQFQASRKGRKL
jgi:hypothetical protein